jgi:hypothetical protein
VHRYHAKKQLLYEAEERKIPKRGGVAVMEVQEEEKVVATGEGAKRKRGRPKKRPAVGKEGAEKENTGNESLPFPTHRVEPAKRMKVDTTVTTSRERPALEALASNRAVGVRQLVLHPAMQMLEID